VSSTAVTRAVRRISTTDARAITVTRAVDELGRGLLVLLFLILYALVKILPAWPQERAPEPSPSAKTTA
jgi:hypothetical protein